MNGIRFDWYRVAPAQLGPFLKSLLGCYEILRGQGHPGRQIWEANVFQVPAAVDAARQLFYGLPFTATSDGGVGRQKNCEFPRISRGSVENAYICIHLCSSDRTAAYAP